MAINKKQNILKTAADLFSSQGVDNTSTLQIAKEAKVEPGADMQVITEIAITVSDHFCAAPLGGL